MSFLKNIFGSRSASTGLSKLRSEYHTGIKPSANPATGDLGPDSPGGGGGAGRDRPFRDDSRGRRGRARNLGGVRTPLS